MKFREKPTMIEAVQWFPGVVIKGINATNAMVTNTAYIEDDGGSLQVVHIGDWIITAIDGKKYACKPDVFEQTYEREPEDVVLEAIERHEEYYHED